MSERLNVEKGKTFQILYVVLKEIEKEELLKVSLIPLHRLTLPKNAFNTHFISFSFLSSMLLRTNC